jgi:hypothetical protein
MVFVALIIPLVSFFILGFPVAAEAQTNNHNPHLQAIQYQCYVPFTKTDWDTQSTPQLKPCRIPKFDTTRGTLEQIQLTLTQSSIGEIGIENTSSKLQRIDLSPEFESTLMSTDGSQLLVLKSSPQTIKLNPTLQSFDAILDYQGQSGQLFDRLSYAESQSVILSDYANLKQFTSSMPGLITFIDLNANTKTTIYQTGSESQSDSNIHFYSSLFTKLGVSVVYTFVTANEIQLPLDTVQIIDEPEAQNLLRTGGHDDLKIAYISSLGLLSIVSIMFAWSSKREIL